MISAVHWIALASVAPLTFASAAPITSEETPTAPAAHREQIERRYSTTHYLQQRFLEQPPRLAAPADARELAAWRTRATQRLLDIFGVDESQPVTLNPRVGKPKQRDGYTLRHVVFSAEKNVDVPGWLLIPDGVSAAKPAPAVLCLHGGVPGAKDEVAGELQNPAAARGHKVYGDDYARQFVREGFVAFVPDFRNFGERKEVWSPDVHGLNDDARYNRTYAAASLLLGQSFFGLNLFDARRALDFLETLPEVRKDAIAAVGFSFGGNLAAWLAAADRRIAVVGMEGNCPSWRRAMAKPLDGPAPAGSKPGFHLFPGITAQLVPAFLRDFDMHLSLALAAPTPMIIANEYESWAFADLDEAKADAKVIEDIYAGFAARDRIQIEHVRGPHRWNEHVIVPWVTSRLRSIAAAKGTQNHAITNP